ncbi:CAP domain-containing protein, partial [Klebsiella pneumoniae]|nr:CAP domain-containing protein [Klebsiella pneumoniae]
CREAKAYLKGIIKGTIELSILHLKYHVIVLPGADNVNAETIFNSMYSQSEFYDYENEPEEHEAYHFTQIVWKKTTRVGFALLFKKNTYYFSALYEPIGNIE